MTMDYADVFQKIVANLISPQCYETLFIQQNLFDAPCLKLTLSKGLSYGIIAGSFALKIPQILKIVSAKSAEGLSAANFFLSLISYTITVAYSSSKGFALSTYGEQFVIAIQDAIIILLIALYQNSLGLIFLFTSALYLGFSGYLMSPAVDPSLLATLQILTIPLFGASRLIQIWTNFKNGSTGQLAFATQFLQFGGNCARLFTTLQEVPDQLTLLSVVIAAFLNGILLLQFVIYWNAPAKQPASTNETKKGK